jgi:hypothetical protein
MLRFWKPSFLILVFRMNMHLEIIMLKYSRNHELVAVAVGTA